MAAYMMNWGIAMLSSYRQIKAAGNVLPNTRYFVLHGLLLVAFLGFYFAGCFLAGVTQREKYYAAFQVLEEDSTCVQNPQKCKQQGIGNICFMIADLLEIISIFVIAYTKLPPSKKEAAKE